MLIIRFIYEDSLSGSDHFHPKGRRIGGFNGGPPIYGVLQKASVATGLSKILT